MAICSQPLRELLKSCAGRKPFADAADPQRRQHALELAQRQNLLQRLRDSLGDDEPVPLVRRSLFREYRRTGRRTALDKLDAGFMNQIERAAMLCWLTGEKLDYLQDLIWALCERTWWILSAHEHKNCPVDLRAATHAAQLGLIARMLGDRLEDEVVERMGQEVRRRIGDTMADPACDLWWETWDNNWPAVCGGGAMVGSLVFESDPERLSAIVERAVGALRSSLRSFTADGGCSEGPSYWRFGFGWYVRAAEALRECTDGAIDLLDEPNIEAISRYPLAAALAPGQDATFADAHSGFLSPWLARVLDERFSIPQLRALCKPGDDGAAAIGDAMELLYCESEPVPPFTPTDRYLPQLQLATLRHGALTLSAKAGHNNELHNHNDVGSFIVHRGRTCFLTDPGAPIYSASTFSEDRYQSVFTNSFGHSVPRVNGRLQGFGRDFSGTMRVEGLDARGAKSIKIELAGAYDDPTLKGLSRTLAIRAGQLEIRDEFAFSDTPEALEEAFVSYLPCRVEGRRVLIDGGADGTAVLDAGSPGAFEVDELVEESAAEARGGEVLRRIVFRPGGLAQRMELVFHVRWEESSNR
jgi:hypothetical protein